MRAAYLAIGATAVLLAACESDDRYDAPYLSYGAILSGGAATIAGRSALQLRCTYAPGFSGDTSGEIVVYFDRYFDCLAALDRCLAAEDCPVSKATIAGRALLDLTTGAIRLPSGEKYCWERTTVQGELKSLGTTTCASTDTLATCTAQGWSTDYCGLKRTCKVSQCCGAGDTVAPCL